jgi:hypothetical protein
MVVQVYDQVNQDGVELEDDKELGIDSGVEIDPDKISNLNKPMLGSDPTNSYTSDDHLDNGQDPAARGAGAGGSNLTPFQKGVVALTFTAGMAGLIGGLASLRTGDKNSPSAASDSGGSSAGSPGPTIAYSSFAALPQFGEAVLDGYTGDDGCDILEEDLLEAVELMTNITIDSLATSHFNNPWTQICRGGLDVSDCHVVAQPYYNNKENVADSPPALPDGVELAPGDEQFVTTTSSEGEDSFGTNNQVMGVDEADFVKSDGTHVYAAYHDKIVVWSADGGTLLSETVLPTDDDEGIEICSKMEVVDSTTSCYEPEYGFYMFRKNRKRKTSMAMPMNQDPIKIAGLMLHDNKLVVIGSTRFQLRNSNSVLNNDRNTRVFMYDVTPENVPTDESALTLLARKDLQGEYKTGRSIDNHAHIVASSTLSRHEHLDEHIYPWKIAFAGMTEEEYRVAALEVAREKATLYASKLTSELAEVFQNDCSKLAKIAVMLQEQLDGESALPSFSNSAVLQTLTQVHSFDMQEEFFLQTKMLHSYPKVSAQSSGIFFPTASYTSNVYASAEKLVVTGEAYAEDSSGVWNERTVFLVYSFDGGSTTPDAVGEVPGSLLNQFSMDHYYDAASGENYLRVATTSWGKWGMVDGTWGQTSVSESQISVLKMPASGSEGGTMDLVGSATGIGLGERIFAARFYGTKAYVVTCEYETIIASDL